MPRETLTAPLILPLACTSDGSRTSRINALPSIRVRISAGDSRGTAALASANICLTLDGMVPSLAARQKTRLFARAKRRVDPFGVGLLNLRTVARALWHGAMPDARFGGTAVMAHCITGIRYYRSQRWRDAASRSGTVRGTTGAKGRRNTDCRQKR